MPEYFSMNKTCFKCVELEYYIYDLISALNIKRRIKFYQKIKTEICFLKNILSYDGNVHEFCVSNYTYYFNK